MIYDNYSEYNNEPMEEGEDKNEDGYYDENGNFVSLNDLAY